MLKHSKLFLFLNIVIYFFYVRVYSNLKCVHLFEKYNLVHEKVMRNDFVYERNLIEYISILGLRFIKKLSKMNKKHHWIDMGSGELIAILEYLKQYSIDKNLQIKKELEKLSGSDYIYTKSALQEVKKK